MSSVAIAIGMVSVMLLMNCKKGNIDIGNWNALMIKSILNGCLLFKNTNPVRNMNNNEVIG